MWFSEWTSLSLGIRCDCDQNHPSAASSSKNKKKQQHKNDELNNASDKTTEIRNIQF